MRARARSVREKTKAAIPNHTLARDVALEYLEHQCDDVIAERRAAIVESNEAPVCDPLRLIAESRVFPGERAVIICCVRRQRLIVPKKSASRETVLGRSAVNVGAATAISRAGAQKVARPAAKVRFSVLILSPLRPQIGFSIVEVVSREAEISAPGA